ncbi:MAG TPA: class I SAM-dependent methyltransferase [Woeseiaceae bacterium]|nr:class I SAM-dependent methyltransferase [Woeseiaceae bacterium]
MPNQVNSSGLREFALPVLTNPLLQSIREQFESAYLKQFGMRTGSGLYKNADWRRLEFATSLIPDNCKSVLDVGVGPGAFLNFLSMSGRFDRVTGIDKRRYSKFIELAPNLDYRIMNVGKTSFPDASFDLVICMEVLEHLDTATLTNALSELRRITCKKLIMTVPFNEPLPLPSYHLQQFDENRIRETFPSAEILLLHRNKEQSTWPWAVLVEEF